MIRLDAATVLLQWSVGGLAFLWVTSRRRQVGIGYGWLLRISYAALALAAMGAGLATEAVPGRDLGAAAVAGAALWALAVSVKRRRAGVAGERERTARRVGRVREMLGQDSGGSRNLPDASVPEFPPQLDLVAPAIGALALLVAGIDAGDPDLLSVVRVLAGAAFLGAVTDAMLLGHWYLVQPGLGREPLLDLVRWLALVWPIEVAALLWPTGMVDVITGSVDDGIGGLFGWIWIACAVTTLALCAVTRAALAEKAYAAVMAATGLLYLAILTAFGTDLIARAVLA